jgi:hypothetical protein
MVQTFIFPKFCFHILIETLKNWFRKSFFFVIKYSAALQSGNRRCRHKVDGSQHLSLQCEVSAGLDDLTMISYTLYWSNSPLSQNRLLPMGMFHPVYSLYWSSLSQNRLTPMGMSNPVYSLFWRNSSLIQSRLAPMWIFHPVCNLYCNISSMIQNRLTPMGMFHLVYSLYWSSLSQNRLAPMGMFHPVYGLYWSNSSLIQNGIAPILIFHPVYIACTGTTNY